MRELYVHDTQIARNAIDRKYIHGKGVIFLTGFQGLIFQCLRKHSNHSLSSHMHITREYRAMFIRACLAILAAMAAIAYVENHSDTPGSHRRPLKYRGSISLQSFHLHARKLASLNGPSKYHSWSRYVFKKRRIAGSS